MSKNVNSPFNVEASSVIYVGNGQSWFGYLTWCWSQQCHICRQWWELTWISYLMLKTAVSYMSAMVGVDLDILLDVEASSVIYVGNGRSWLGYLVHVVRGLGTLGKPNICLNKIKNKISKCMYICTKLLFQIINKLKSSPLASNFIYNSKINIEKYENMQVYKIL